jgi:20S proteasome alpha/beta subunit
LHPRALSAGAYFGWRASAIGKNFTNAKTFLEKVRLTFLHSLSLAGCLSMGWRLRHPFHISPLSPCGLLATLPSPYLAFPTCLLQRYSEDMELEDAIHTSLLTLREGFEGEMTATNIELAVVGPDRKFRVLTAAEVADYLAEAD